MRTPELLLLCLATSVLALVLCHPLCLAGIRFLCVQPHVLLVQPLLVLLQFLPVHPLLPPEQRPLNNENKMIILPFNMLPQPSTKSHSLLPLARDPILQHKRNISPPLLPHRMHTNNSSSKPWLRLKLHSINRVSSVSKVSAFLSNRISKFRIPKQFLRPIRKPALALFLDRDSGLNAKASSRMGRSSRNSMQFAHLQIRQRSTVISTRLARVLLVVFSLRTKSAPTSALRSSR